MPTTLEEPLLFLSAGAAPASYTLTLLWGPTHPTLPSMVPGLMNDKESVLRKVRDHGNEVVFAQDEVYV